MSILTRYFFFAALLFIASSGSGQNYIGLHKDEIRDRVKQELSGFAFTKEVFNLDRSFIKFENTFEEQTLLFMLNADGYCTSVSRMYNTWLFNRLRDELNDKYGKQKGLIWEEEKDGKKFVVELIKGEWFITVLIKLKK
jgi:hypothetical protein